MCESVAGVQALTRLLLIFYQQHTDQERLVSLPHLAGTCPQAFPPAQALLSHKWLQSKAALAREACASPVCAYHLRCVLVLTCHTLHSAPTQPLACPLRMLEVFTDPHSYPSGNEGRAFARSLLRHLVDNGVCL